MNRRVSCERKGVSQAQPVGPAAVCTVAVHMRLAVAVAVQSACPQGCTAFWQCWQVQDAALSLLSVQQRSGSSGHVVMQCSGRGLQQQGATGVVANTECVGAVRLGPALPFAGLLLVSMVAGCWAGDCK